MIVIISDDSKGKWGVELADALSRRETEVVHVEADTLNIKPCTACSSCSGKTYGRCVIPDDMQQVLPKIAGCRALVLVSPVVFGGVSHHIKKVMDRMSTLGDPRYHISGGEMVKGMNGKGMDYYMVGIGDTLSERERSDFSSRGAPSSVETLTSSMGSISSYALPDGVTMKVSSSRRPLKLPHVRTTNPISKNFCAKSTTILRILSSLSCCIFHPCQLGLIIQ